MIFETVDPLTRDGLLVERDGERTLLHALLEGTPRVTVVLARRADAERLGRALLPELRAKEEEG
ncbi:MAG TPA: hypothetical protein VML91_10945 [Burkholderiales bacterium]|nr:hypothetical protein [Burkholderiales bacterium]